MDIKTQTIVKFDAEPADLEWADLEEGRIYIDSDGDVCLSGYRWDKDDIGAKIKCVVYIDNSMLRGFSVSEDMESSLTFKPFFGTVMLTQMRTQ